MFISCSCVIFTITFNLFSLISFSSRHHLLSHLLHRDNAARFFPICLIVSRILAQRPGGGSQPRSGRHCSRAHVLPHHRCRSRSPPCHRVRGRGSPHSCCYTRFRSSSRPVPVLRLATSHHRHRGAFGAGPTRTEVCPLTVWLPRRKTAPGAAHGVLPHAPLGF